MQANIAFDNALIFTADIECIVARRKEADVLRHRRNKAAAELKRRTAEVRINGVGAELDAIRPVKAMPEIGFQVRLQQTRRSLHIALQSKPDPTSPAVVGVKIDRRETILLIIEIEALVDYLVDAKELLDQPR